MNARSQKPTVSADALIASGKRVLRIEQAALADVEAKIGEPFAAACQLIMQCQGRVVCSGMGKSGHIARKIAATLASTGTPAFFLHPGEASHGDLGMVTDADVVLALSNSGESEELLTIVPALKRQGNAMIAITGKPNSSLARHAEVHLLLSVPEEACSLNLAPTASTTAALALGDALAVAVLDARGFTAEDFARSHPAGSLGRRLLLHIRDVMHTGSSMPQVSSDATILAALIEMTRTRLGLTAIVDKQMKVVGIFTDGDLRRALDDDHVDVRNTPIHQVMGANPKTVGPDQLASEAAHLMEEHKISGLLVVDDQHKLVGALNIHDLLRSRVV